MVGGSYYLVEFFRRYQTTFIAHDVLERLVAVFAELTRCRLDVLLGKRCRNVGRHQVILRHYVRLKPDTHRIVGAEHHRITHTRYTLYLRDDVDFHVVFDKLIVITVVGRHERKYQQHRRLTFLRDYAHLGYLGGEHVLRLCHAVLHVDGCHVGVEALLEVDVDVCTTGVGRCRFDIGHALRTVDLLLDWGYHRVEYCLGVGTGVGRRHANGRRCYVRILRYG